MKRSTLLLGAAAIIAAGYLYIRSAPEPTPKSPEATASSTPSGDCRAVRFQNKSFTECIAIPGKHRIETKVTGSDGVIYRGFARLRGDLKTQDVAFAVNGGMYDDANRPIGYYVEKGERLYRLNLRDADGNFHMKPNGVFFGDEDGNWQVMTSDDFAAKITKRPQFGTQSGPMLLIGGKLHPKIAPQGSSLKIRNAVGVDADGRAHFVLSEEPVSFGTLAAMMHDHAGTQDALFLDGTVSSLWDPATSRMDASYPLGPLILVSRRD